MRIPLRNLTPPSVVVRGLSPDDIDMTLLADSIERNGLLVPLTVCDGKIVDGYRRWLCCKAAGWTDIPVHEVTGDPDTLRVIAQSRSTPFDRTDRRVLVGEYLHKHRDATAATIAHTFNWSPAEVESLAGVEYLIQEIKSAYDAGEVTLAEVWQLSRCNDDGQLLVWKEGRDNLYGRAAATLRQIRSARRRNLAARPRGKTYNQIVKERERLTNAGIELIKSKAESPLDGWIACINWVLSSK